MNWPGRRPPVRESKSVNPVLRCVPFGELLRSRPIGGNGSHLAADRFETLSGVGTCGAVLAAGAEGFTAGAEMGGLGAAVTGAAVGVASEGGAVVAGEAGIATAGAAAVTEGAETATASKAASSSGAKEAGSASESTAASGTAKAADRAETAKPKSVATPSKRGTATVRWDPDMGSPDHTTIRVDAPGQPPLETEQVINGVPDINGSFSGQPTPADIAEELGPNTIERTFDLPDAAAAREAQEDSIDAELGPYDGINNSCVTYCVDILRAGGVDIPGGGRGRVRLKRMLDE
jgi:hypothetical protein